MNSLLTFGLTQLFRGARRGQALVAGFGAVLTVIGLARRLGGPDSKLLYSRTLEEDESLTVKFKRGAAIEGDG